MTSPSIRRVRLGWLAFMSGAVTGLILILRLLTTWPLPPSRLPSPELPAVRPKAETPGAPFSPIGPEPDTTPRPVAPARPLALDAGEMASSFDLLRVSAFANPLRQEGPLLDPASPSFPLLAEAGSFAPPALELGRPARELIRSSARFDLWFPLKDAYDLLICAKGPESGSVSLRVASGRVRSERVRFSSKDFAPIRIDLNALGPLESRRLIDLQAEGKSRGFHISRLHFRPKSASDRLSVCQSAESLPLPPEGRPLPGPEGGRPGDADQREIRLASSESFTILTLLPESEPLRLVATVRPWRSGQPAGEAVLTLRSHGRPPVVLTKTEVSDGETTLSADLNAHMGELVWLAVESPPETEARPLRVSRFALERAQSAGVAPAYLPPKNLIVYLSDTLRWDRVHFFSPKTSRIVTPAFDFIARHGVAFENAVSQGNWSKPAQAALMTGEYPWRIDMMGEKDLPPTSLPFIATALKRERPDLATLSFSANGYVSCAFGFCQTWDLSRNTIREELSDRTEFLFSLLFPQVEKVRAASRPFFLWIGTVDPHVAYNPPWRDLQLYAPHPYRGPVNPWTTPQLLEQVNSGKTRLSREDWRRLVALYNGEVTYNDRHLGVLLHQLEEWGLREETAILLVSDHGEEFLDHGRVGHGGSLWDEVVRVPFILYYPRGFPRPRVVSDAVETRSLFATLLDLADPSPDGRPRPNSLLPYLVGRPPLWPRLARVRSGPMQQVVSAGRWRLMSDFGRTRLYDIVADPRQRKDLTDARPDVTYYLIRRSQNDDPSP